jgi:hypothetical protein
MIAIIYIHSFYVSFLYVQMSSNPQQPQAVNKKQRRKTARSNLQSSRPPDDDNVEINETQVIISTQNNHQQVNDLSLTANGIQGLVLNVNEQPEHV